MGEWVDEGLVSGLMFENFFKHTKKESPKGWVTKISGWKSKGVFRGLVRLKDTQLCDIVVKNAVKYHAKHIDLSPVMTGTRAQNGNIGRSADPMVELMRLTSLCPTSCNILRSILSPLSRVIFSVTRTTCTTVAPQQVHEVEPGAHTERRMTEVVVGAQLAGPNLQND